MTTADLARRLDNLIRLGTIAEVDVAAARVRVRTGQLLTSWLPWLALRAGTTKHWSAPTVGEQVMLFSPSGEPSQGVALVGLYSEANPANANSATVHRTTYPDGAVLEYDHAAHLLRTTLPAAGRIEVQAPAGVELLAIGGVNITGTVTVVGDVIANGISLIEHRHKDTMPGNGTTGVPQA